MDPLLFNPSQASLEELEKTFVGRWDLLREAEENLRSRHPLHWMLVGPRGSGKSHLCELLARRLEGNGWLVSRLPEENWQIGSLRDLLAMIHMQAGGAELADDAREEELLATLKTAAGKRRVLVVAENLNTLFDRQITQARDQDRLRSLLEADPAPFVVLGSATAAFERNSDVEARLGDILHTRALADLSKEEVLKLFEARAEWDDEGGLLENIEAVRPKIDAIFHFSGGNPRLVVALYCLLRRGVTGELRSQLMRLLDEITPYYQARLDDVSAQMARVLVEFSLSPTAQTPSVIARKLGLQPNLVTSLVSRLVEQRMLRSGSRLDGRRQLYEVSDRLFRIWIRMRQAGARRQLAFLTEFFERWYAGDEREISAAASRVARTFWREVAAGKQTRCGELLQTMQSLADASQSALDLLVRVVFESEKQSPSEAKAAIENVRALVDAAKTTEERSIYLVALSRTLSRAGRSREATNALREATACSSPFVWALYLEALSEDAGIEVAFSEGMEALTRDPAKFEILRDRLAAWAVSLDRPEVAEKLISELRGDSVCSHCRNGVRIEHAIRLFLNGNSALGEKALQEADQKDPSINIPRLAAVLRGPDTATGEPDFSELVASWRDVDDIPLWLLEQASCGYTHRGTNLPIVVSWLRLIHEKSNRSAWPDFGKHAIEVLVRLLAVERSQAESFADWLGASVPEIVEPAFRDSAPQIARYSPELRKAIVDAFELLTARKLVPADLLPYAPALQVARDGTDVLLSLHPEVREAVELLTTSGPVEGLAVSRAVARAGASQLATRIRASIEPLSEQSKALAIELLQRHLNMEQYRELSKGGASSALAELRDAGILSRRSSGSSTVFWFPIGQPQIGKALDGIVVSELLRRQARHALSSVGYFEANGVELGAKHTK